MSQQSKEPCKDLIHQESTLRPNSRRPILSESMHIGK